MIVSTKILKPCKGSQQYQNYKTKKNINKSCGKYIQVKEARLCFCKVLKILWYPPNIRKHVHRWWMCRKYVGIFEVHAPGALQGEQSGYLKRLCSLSSFFFISCCCFFVNAAVLELFTYSALDFSTGPWICLETEGLATRVPILWPSGKICIQKIGNEKNRRQARIAIIANLMRIFRGP